MAEETVGVDKRSIAKEMSLQPFRLLIVGAGLTGAVSASLIKQHLPANIQIHVWEKSRGIGGRMTTHRDADGLSSVDLGAQYITRTRQYAEKHDKFFKDLLGAGVLMPFPGTIAGEKVNGSYSDNFMAPNGINSVVKHFFSSSGAAIKTQTFCSDISLSNEGENISLWRATKNGGTSEEFHGIILTIPVPQIFKLTGNFHECLLEHRLSLQQVEYSSRYAMAMYFPKETRFDVPWTAKYVTDNFCIRFVCIDSAKRGKGSSEASLLVHTSVPFGLKYLESDIAEVEEVIYGHFQELFPVFPRPQSTRCIRWRYSQVHKRFPGQPGALVACDKPLLVLAGDGLVHSNFSGCVESSMTLLEKLRQHFGAR